MAIEPVLVDGDIDVYVFGSALDSNSPSDIDILLISPRARLGEAVMHARVLESREQFPPFDVTVLSTEELGASAFLERLGAVTVVAFLAEAVEP